MDRENNNTRRHFYCYGCQSHFNSNPNSPTLICPACECDFVEIVNTRSNSEESSTEEFEPIPYLDLGPRYRRQPNSRRNHVPLNQLLNVPEDFLSHLLNFYDRMIGSNTGHPPASSDDLRNITDYQITQEDIDNRKDCPICMEDFALNETSKRLPCKHSFHENCIMQWLEQRGTCPVCRRTLQGQDTSRQEHSLPGSITSDNNNDVRNFPTDPRVIRLLPANDRIFQWRSSNFHGSPMSTPSSTSLSTSDSTAFFVPNSESQEFDDNPMPLNSRQIGVDGMLDVIEQMVVNVATVLNFEEQNRRRRELIDRFVHQDMVIMQNGEQPTRPSPAARPPTTNTANSMIHVLLNRNPPPSPNDSSTSINMSTFQTSTNSTTNLAQGSSTDLNQNRNSNENDSSTSIGDHLRFAQDDIE